MASSYEWILNDLWFRYTIVYIRKSVPRKVCRTVLLHTHASTMDKAQIALMAHEMKDRDDLLLLLNHISHHEMLSKGYADRYPFTLKQINFYCNPNHARYRRFDIKKKNGGTRQISAPKFRVYKYILRSLNIILQSIYTPSECAMGFAPGRSVASNADKHKGMNYILNLDLKDFFPSIHQARLWKRLQLWPFNFPVPVTNVIAGLCFIKESRKNPDGTTADFYVLPQGAPTSPVITNMICDKLDRRLAGVAKRFGLNYTRYADDITFSSMHNVYGSDGDFMREVQRIITEQGFTINDKKTRLQKIGGRQEVTGVIVSNKLNVTQAYVRDIRNLLYIWSKYGYGVASSRFLHKYREDKGHVKNCRSDMVNVIRGRLAYIKMVKGEDDSVYKRLSKRFDTLTATMHDSSRKSAFGVVYVDTKPVREFETANSTNIVITRPADKDTVTDTDKTPHRYAYFELNGMKILASVSKKIPEGMESQKDKLAISACRDAHGKPFWLIHKLNKTLVHTYSQIDIDELNSELDSLLNLSHD